MTEEISQIIKRIKGLREIYGISQESLAEYIGISAHEYSNIESGKSDFTLALLIKISKKFNIELSSLLTGEEPKLHQYCVVRKGQGVSVDRSKQYKYESLAYNFVHKQAEPFIVVVDPKPENNELSLNSHPGQEFNYVLEGSLIVNIDGHEVLLQEGDSVYFDSSLPHAMKAANNQSARFIAITIQ